MELKTYGCVVLEMVGEIILTLEGMCHVMLSKHSVVRHHMPTVIKGFGMLTREIGHGIYSFHAYHFEPKTVSSLPDLVRNPQALGEKERS